MDFRLDKCVKATSKRGKLARTSDIEVDASTKNKELETEIVYKYLVLYIYEGKDKYPNKIRKKYIIQFKK